jgi:hypothetical protein
MGWFYRAVLVLDGILIAIGVIAALLLIHGVIR